MAEVLPKRFARYGLTLHPDTTRLLRYTRPRGDGDLRSTFDFLGLTQLHFPLVELSFVEPAAELLARFGRGVFGLGGGDEGGTRARRTRVGEQDVQDALLGEGSLGAMGDQEEDDGKAPRAKGARDLAVV